jgi:hypothetical protein
MSSPKNDLQQRLAHYRQIKLSVTGRKSGRTISVPVWFVLDGEKLYLLPCRARTPSGTRTSSRTCRFELMREVQRGCSKLFPSPMPKA